MTEGYANLPEHRQYRDETRAGTLITRVSEVSASRDDLMQLVGTDPDLLAEFEALVTATNANSLNHDTNHNILGADEPTTTIPDAPAAPAENFLSEETPEQDPNYPERIAPDASEPTELTQEDFDLAGY